VQKTDSIHLIAIFPQSVDEGTAYLKKLDVPIADVRQVQFASLPIGGTPTILLVDSAGKVKKVWAGKLESESESELLKEALL
jgi:hypothetical protein